MSEWSVRLATREDLPAIRECFTAVYGRSRPIERDTCLYHTNPAGMAISAIAEAGGQVVGQYAVLPVDLRLDRGRFPSAQSFDTMTLPEFRGQGMMGSLAEACFDRCAELGVDVLFGFPNDKSYRPLLRANYAHVVDVGVLRRPMAGSPGTGGARARSAAIGAAGRVLPKGRQGGFATDVLAAEQAPLEEIQRLWQQQDGGCRVDRSPEWWSWRFAPQMGEYEWIVSRTSSGELAAAVVLGLGAGEAGIAEIVGTDPRSLESAVATAVRRAGGTGCSSIRTVTNRPEAIRALHRAGFVGRKGLPLIVRRISYRTLPANVHEPAAWRVTAADIDTF